MTSAASHPEARTTQPAERLRFATGDSALGPMLVAASDAGLAAILFGDDAEAMGLDLQSRFPHAALVAGDAQAARLFGQVAGFVAAPGAGLDLPLDPRGTAFQRRVWRELQAIRPGATASYADIALRIGAPQAVRAVAGACAANRLAVAIPCHRVIRRDGGLSGYRWGLARKRELLAREAGR